MYSEVIMPTFSISIGKEDYKPFEKVEGLTGKECYDKFGFKRAGHLDIDLNLNDRYTLYLSMCIPMHEEDTTYAVGTLYDRYTKRYYDNYECDDTILGEWYFEDIVVELGLH